MRRDQALELLRHHRPRLAKLGVRHAYLFGSVAKDTATNASDVDIMIDLEEGPGGIKPLFSAFDLGGIQYELAQILGCRVDVVVRGDVLKAGKLLKFAAETQLVDAF